MIEINDRRRTRGAAKNGKLSRKPKYGLLQILGRISEIQIAYILSGCLDFFQNTMKANSLHCDL